MLTTIALLSATFLSALLFLGFGRRPVSQYRLPPQLPGLPVIGNLFDALGITHVKVEEWKKQVGSSIFSLSVMGQVIVVLGDAKSASGVLDKMSNVTSDRPHNLNRHEAATHGLNLAFAHYNDLWRKLRRGAHEGLNVRAAEAFYAVQQDEALLFAKALLLEKANEDLPPQTLRVAASIVWRALYGGPTLREDSKNLQTVDGIAETFLRILTPLSIAEFCPALLRLPAWLSPWKREADETHNHMTSFFERIRKEAVQRRTTSIDPNSLNLTATIDAQKERLELTDKEVAWLSGIVFTAAESTFASTLQWFILAMLLHPEVVKRAQEDLDNVVGHDQPPDFGHKSRLPYIEAIGREVMRWRPAVPLGIPHTATEDFQYDGYTIPKHATIFGAVWSASHDPTIFDSPSTFDPSRFLTLGLPHGRPADYAFGFGRRLCVGRDVVLNQLFIIIATVLWAFEFEYAKDETGKEQIPDPDDFGTGTDKTLRPAAFRFGVKPRSARVLQVLQGHKSESAS